MMRLLRRSAVVCLIVIAQLAPAAEPDQRPPAAAIASAHPLATEAGFEILKAGGNAFDAAVAVSAALAVVEPRGSGVGGGGFYLLHRASDGLELFVDAREVAPAAAHRDMFLGPDGAVAPGTSLDTALAAAIPGEPAGWAQLAERYGRLPLSRSLEPAIRLAWQGFPVYPRLVEDIERRKAGLLRTPDGQRIFLVHGRPPEVGGILKQRPGEVLGGSGSTGS